MVTMPSKAMEPMSHCNSKKKVYVEYCPLIVKMHVIVAKNEVALKNLNSLCDVKLILGLPCILLLLECLHMLIKFAQGRKMIVHDFVKVVKLTQQELFIFYCDSFLSMKIQHAIISIFFLFYPMTLFP
jgi:hypothetical protein